MKWIMGRLLMVVAVAGFWGAVSAAPSAGMDRDAAEAEGAVLDLLGGIAESESGGKLGW